jgi:YaaC-like protein
MRHPRLYSEDMAGSGWQKCKFLESGENLKPLVKMRFGREPSSSLAREISACLQQGRLFYEAAASSSLEIKPLQQFYGMVGFARALVLAQRLQSLSTLKPSHGIRDVSEGNSRIADLRVHVDRAGTFQEFNDVVAPLTRLCYIDNATNNRTVSLPSSDSSKLYGMELSLREIFSHITELGPLYRMTFGDDPDTETLLVQQSLQQEEEFRIRADEKELFSSSESLRIIVTRLRRKLPFLDQWRLNSAQHGWGKSIIHFRNMGKTAIDEFSEPYMHFSDGSYEERPVPNDTNESFSIATGLHPLAGGFSSSTNAVSPINDLHVSEFSFQYLALFLLSSLVRYRPQIWTHAISRSTFQEIPPDDKALSLIEEFLALNSTILPDVVATILNPHEDAWFK